jgi:hypothetical protein
MIEEQVSSFSLNVVRNTPYLLQFLFAGELFKFQQDLNSGATGTFSINFKTGATKIIHIVQKKITTSVTNVANLTFRENSGASPGTSYPTFNQNRILGDNPTLTAFTSGALGGGLTLETESIDTNNPGTLITPEFILKKNVVYSFNIVSVPFTPFNFELLWYEETPNNYQTMRLPPATIHLVARSITHNDKYHPTVTPINIVAHAPKKIAMTTHPISKSINFAIPSPKITMTVHPISKSIHFVIPPPLVI